MTTNTAKLYKCGNRTVHQLVVPVKMELTTSIPLSQPNDQNASDTTIILWNIIVYMMFHHTVVQNINCLYATYTWQYIFN